MRTETSWNIKIIPKNGIMHLEVDYEGEIPNAKAYTELLRVIGNWAERNTTVPIRVFKVPKIMAV